MSSRNSGVTFTTEQVSRGNRAPRTPGRMYKQAHGDHAAHLHAEIDARANPDSAMRRDHPGALVGFDRQDAPRRRKSACAIPARAWEPKYAADVPCRKVTPKVRIWTCGVVATVARIRHQLAEYRISGKGQRV